MFGAELTEDVGGVCACVQQGDPKVATLHAFLKDVCRDHAVDAVVHCYHLTAGLVGHLCALLCAGTALGQAEEQCLPWANMGLFSGGFLTSVPWRLVDPDGVTEIAQDFVSRMVTVRRGDAGAGGGLTVTLTPAGNALYDQLFALQAQTAIKRRSLARQAVKEFEVRCCCGVAGAAVKRVQISPGLGVLCADAVLCGHAVSHWRVGRRGCGDQWCCPGAQ